MPRFNIALLPTDNEVRQNIIKMANEAFSDDAIHYLLGPKAAAHVTLCQFNGDTIEAAQNAFKKFQGKAANGNVLEILIMGYGCKESTGSHKGLFWSSLNVEKSPSLIDIQKNCTKFLSKNSFQILTPSKGYEPHFTLALRKIKDEATLNRTPNLKLLDLMKPVRCQLALGLTDEHGAFIEDITPRL